MLGLSGGIGPIRASISTRGVGGSVGPVNFGTGWGAGGTAGGIGALVVLMFWVTVAAALLGVALVVVAWPLGLGMAVLGENVLGVAIGVVLEVTYLLVALLVWAKRDEARELERAVQQEADARERISAERAAVNKRARRLVDEAPDARAPMAETLSYLIHRPAGFPADEIENLPDDFPRDEMFLGAGSAWLSAGRVATRGGPRVQTDIEHGSWTVSDRCIRFVGATRTEKWPLSAITGVYYEPGRVLFGLSTRSTITGLSSADPEDDLLPLRIALEWGRALPGPPTAAIDLVTSELAAFDASIQSLREHLAADFVEEPLTGP